MKFSPRYMPESPRWLIAQGRRLKARKILQRWNSQIIPTDVRLNNSEENIPSKDFMSGSLIVDSTANISQFNYPIEKSSSKKGGAFADLFIGLKIIFSSSELTIRAFICYFNFMNASLTYYVLGMYRILKVLLELSTFIKYNISYT